MFCDLPPTGTPAAPPLAALLTALAQPECYPHRPARVEVVQTHISAVFFAGEAEVRTHILTVHPS